MWICPVCQRENEKLYICPQCGFDESGDILNHLSPIRLSERQLGALQLQMLWKAADGFDDYYLGLWNDHMAGNVTDEGAAHLLRKEAAAHWKKAADAGNADAYYHLGNYCQTIGAQADMGTSMTWWRLGSVAGSLDAQAAACKKALYLKPEVRKEDVSNSAYLDMALRTVWQETPRGSGILNLKDIIARPLDYYKAYGLITGSAASLDDHPKLLRLEHMTDEKRTGEIEKIRRGAVRLYYDLNIYYTADLLQSTHYERCRSVFSEVYGDGFDAFRYLMLGRLYMDHADMHHSEYYGMAVAVFEKLASEDCALAKGWLKLCQGRLNKKALSESDGALWEESAAIEVLAEQGNAQAQYLLGNLRYASGRYDEAYGFLMQSWNNRCLAAGSLLGRMYARGKYVMKEVDKAFSYIYIAGRMNTSIGLCMLGHCYYDPTYVDKNDVQALRYYKMSALKLDMDAMYAYGRMLLYGEGGTEDIQSAIHWLHGAADAGQTDAQLLLGQLYENGTKISMDLEEAEKWYARAADSHQPQNVMAYGRFLFYKRPEKGSEAVKCLEPMARLGNIEAQYMLGMCYGKGIGVKKDKKMMRHWLERAAARGHEAAGKRLANLWF